jgi:hypothetical protein
LTPEFKAVMSEMFNETKQEATAQDMDALTIRAFKRMASPMFSRE